jgi:DNA (cytosine-5)-methyltransferase 1
MAREIRAESLATFLRHPGELLTHRATAGFLGRTRVAKLRFPDGFIRAVEHHLAVMAPPPERRAA